ncbi:MAG: ABC transporter [Treponema sp. CETP13]|nr:MAG: ABC transporter [Treponema sp. CETP13]
MLKRLLSELKQYKKSTILTMLFAGLEVITDISVPLIMAWIIDYGIVPKNISRVYQFGAIMFIAVIFGLVTGAGAGKFAANAASGFSYNLRKSMFKKIQMFSFSNIDTFSTGGLVTRMTTDVTNVQNSFQMIIRMAVRAPMTFLSALIMVIIIEPRMSGIFIIAIAILVVALFFIIRHALPIFREVFKSYDSLNESVQENIRGIRVVKGFARENFESSKFKKTVEKLYKRFVQAEGTVVLNSPFVMMTVYFCVIMVSWLGAHFVVGGSLSTGELTTLFTYIVNILMSLMMMSMIFVLITISLESMRRIVEVLEENPDIVNPENPVMEVANGDISMDHVNFAYKKNAKKYVLSDINLDIKEGETIGILGGTGSSKTSLINLISRLYETTTGSVKVGGIDVRKYDLKTLRDNVAVVLQKNELFSGSILENLRWGNENATEEECINACKMACADDFIQTFTDKYNTHIEQGGTNVSGGQKQRLCIARALLKKPKILILDDSTNAVDTNTDEKIRNSFYNDIPNTTVIIIAQRILSIKDADRIIVLDDGKINAIGTHDQLKETNDIYRMVYEHQQKDGADFDAKESF